MKPIPESSIVKRGANLLLQGAALTDLSCPACSSPLFRLKDGTLWCAEDEKKVVVVKEGEEAPKQNQISNLVYDKLEATLMAKIVEIEKKIEKTENLDELQKITAALSELLSNLEKLKKIKS